LTREWTKAQKDKQAQSAGRRLSGRASKSLSYQDPEDDPSRTVCPSRGRVRRSYSGSVWRLREEDTNERSVESWKRERIALSTADTRQARGRGTVTGCAEAGSASKSLTTATDHRLTLLQYIFSGLPCLTRPGLPPARAFTRIVRIRCVNGRKDLRVTPRPYDWYTLVVMEGPVNNLALHVGRLLRLDTCLCPKIGMKKRALVYV
jgi:hypothetical protein